MTVILKLMLFMLVTSISENKETCNSRHGKTQSDGLGCNEETKNLYQDLEQRSQEVSRSQSVGAEDAPGLRLVLVGLSGVGKSASGNTILGREAFESKISSSSLTLKSTSRRGEVSGSPVTVVDTPGMFNTELSEEELREEMERAMSLCEPGPHAFLLVIQLGRFTQQERRAVKRLQELLSKSVKDYTVVLFTYGDNLRKVTIEKFISEDTNLQKLISKCGGRYHVFNNKDIQNRNQVRELLEIVKSIGLFFNLVKEREIGSHLLFSLIAELREWASDSIVDWVSVVPNEINEINVLNIIISVTLMWGFQYTIRLLWAGILNKGKNEVAPTKGAESSVSNGEENSKETSETCTPEVPTNCANSESNSPTSESVQPPNI